MSKKKFLWFIPRDSIWHPLAKFLGLPVIVIVALFLLVDEWVMPKITRQGDEYLVILPDVRGMTLQDAKKLLARYEIDSVAIAGKDSISFANANDTIIDQAPAAGSQVKKGRRVKVILSSKEKEVAVPPMLGFSERQVRLKLRECGLRVGTFNWAPEDEDTMQIPNVLAYTIPGVGTDVPKGTSIHLYFSRGPQPDLVFMPRLLGLDLDEARMIVDSVGLGISRIDYAVSCVYLPNTVLWQSIPVDTKVEIGSQIDLKVTVTD